ncbi:MAG: hypothetical protein QM504_01895 [Pseudomonadota bacterium]
MDFQIYLDRIQLFDYLVVALNLLLLISAKRILLFFRAEHSDDSNFILKVQTFRALNLLIILTYGYNNIYQEALSSGFGLKLVTIWVIIYLTYLTKQILSYLMRLKFGRSREINGSKKIIETYTSRLLSMISGVVLFILAYNSSS